MLSMMRGTLCWSALLCRVCGIGTLPGSVLLKTLCSCSYGSMTLMESKQHPCFPLPMQCMELMMQRSVQLRVIRPPCHVQVLCILGVSKHTEAAVAFAVMVDLAHQKKGDLDALGTVQCSR